MIVMSLMSDKQKDSSELKLSKEHCNNVRLDQSKHSVVTKHIISSNHSFDWEDVEILDYEKRNISENLFHNPK